MSTPASTADSHASLDSATPATERQSKGLAMTPHQHDQDLPGDANQDSRPPAYASPKTDQRERIDPVTSDLGSSSSSTTSASPNDSSPLAVILDAIKQSEKRTLAAVRAAEERTLAAVEAAESRSLAAVKEAEDRSLAALQALESKLVATIDEKVEALRNDLTSPLNAVRKTTSTVKKDVDALEEQVASLHRLAVDIINRLSNLKTCPCSQVGLVSKRVISPVPLPNLRRVDSDQRSSIDILHDGSILGPHHTR